jgi:dimethylargininase
VTTVERRRVDVPLALQQWDAHADALRSVGWDLIEVRPADDCPDAVFVEDTAVMFGDLAVLTRPGADARKPEVAAVEAVLGSLGVPMQRIEAPGTLDGGDVLKVGDTAYVGLGGRTDAEGIAQLRRIVAPIGVRVVAVPVTKVLHLKSAVTALPDGTIIGHPPLVDDTTLFDRFLAMPEESGSHVVVLDERRVLMVASCPRSAEVVAELGYEPVVVDIGEFEKLEGCVTCLSIRMREAA